MPRDLRIHPMLAITGRSGFVYNEPNDRQPETLVTTERWWRDCYNDIAGFALGTTPSGKHPGSRQAKAHSTEDCQATMVRVVTFLTSPSAYIPA